MESPDSRDTLIETLRDLEQNVFPLFGRADLTSLLVLD